MERAIVASSPAIKAEKGGGPSNTRIEPGLFIVLTSQLALVIGLAWVYRLELERGFGIVGTLTLVGFVIHSWLPARMRIPFFLLLTSIAIGILLGWDGLWLLGLGLGLLGICHLPISWWARVILIFAAGGALASARAGWVDTPWAAAVVPVLAAMFMFRLILYMYDLKGEKTPAGWAQRFAYFFLLPNVCFPLFPVIDFKAFVRGYYDAPASEIYQKGLFWMLRGLTHLLLYRLIYHVLPTADAEMSVLGIYAFMAMTYGLYLRVSGLFHLIVGILCLFGFNLPSTNNHYFLASSFTDLWRRINIYWKDFMMTIVFYPVFLGIRRGGIVLRIVLATACVFVATWFLHSYQWFWLQGVFPITDRDIVFWGVLGVALAANSVREARHGRSRKIQQEGFSWRKAFLTTASTIGVFTVMAVLWSLWNSDSLLEWGYRLLRAQESTPLDWGLFVGLLAGVVGLGIAALWLEAHDLGLTRIEGFAWRHAPAYVPSVAIGILLIGQPVVYEELGQTAALVVSKVQSTALNRLDADRQERGYYEVLSRSIQLEPNVAAPDEDFRDFRGSPAVRPTDDARGYELVPEIRISFRGSEFRTNRWGLHDRDYPKAKQPETYRMALIGSSIVMGWGVDHDQTFENVIEDRLNQEQAGQPFQRFEILNFSVGGYNVLQALYVAEHEVAAFEPDAVLYVIHNNEMDRLIERLQLMLKLGVELDETYLPVRQAIEETGAHAYLPANEFSRRLDPYRDEILAWAYTRMVNAVQKNGSTMVFVLIRTASGDFQPKEARRLKEMAEAAGGVVLHPQGIFDGYELTEIQLSEGDAHPGVLGHQLIADALYEELLAHAEQIGLVSKGGVPARR